MEILAQIPLQKRTFCPAVGSVVSEQNSQSAPVGPAHAAEEYLTMSLFLGSLLC